MNVSQDLHFSNLYLTNVIKISVSAVHVMYMLVWYTVYIALLHLSIINEVYSNSTHDSQLTPLRGKH